MSASKFIGRAIPRVEDGPLVSGAGKYVDDIHLPNTLEAAFLRSSFAHAKINSIDTSAARAAPGVHAILTYDNVRPLLTADRLPLELRLDPLPTKCHPISVGQQGSGLRRRGYCGCNREFAVSGGRCCSADRDRL